MTAWTLNDHGSFHRMAGGLALAVTDQRNRNCGFCWHVSAPDHRIGDNPEIAGGAGMTSADEAKRAAEEYVREFCTSTLADLLQQASEAA